MKEVLLKYDHTVTFWVNSVQRLNYFDIDHIPESKRSTLELNAELEKRGAILKWVELVPDRNSEINLEIRPDCCILTIHVSDMEKYHSNSDRDILFTRIGIIENLLSGAVVYIEYNNGDKITVPLNPGEYGNLRAMAIGRRNG